MGTPLDLSDCYMGYYQAGTPLYGVLPSRYTVLEIIDLSDRFMAGETTTVFKNSDSEIVGIHIP